MRPGDLIEFGPVGSNGSFKSPWMQQRLAAAKTRRAIYVAQHERIVAGLEARVAKAEKDAARWRFVRAADADIDQPYVARHRQDSWGNDKTEWLMHNDADAAIDAFLAKTAEG